MHLNVYHGKWNKQHTKHPVHLQMHWYHQQIHIKVGGTVLVFDTSEWQYSSSSIKKQSLNIGFGTISNFFNETFNE